MSTYKYIIDKLSGKQGANAKPAPETVTPTPPATTPSKHELVQPVAAPQASTTQPSTKTDNPFDATSGFYENAWRYVNKGREPETPEQAAAREKREKARRNVTALADGIAALANAFGVSQGAQAVDLPSLSVANMQRYNYAKKLREENEDVWRHGLFNARVQDVMDMRENQRLRERMAIEAEEREYRRGRDKVSDEKWKQEFDARRKSEDTRNEQWEKEFEQRVKDQEEARRIQRANLSLATSRAQQSGEGATYKTARYSFSDGTNIEFPADLEEKFYADAYDLLAKEMGMDKDGKMRVEAIYDKNLGKFSTVSPAAAKRATVIEYARNYPNVERFMAQNAYNMNRYYHGKPVEQVQTPGEVHVLRTPMSEKPLPSNVEMHNLDKKPFAPNWGFKE